MILNTMSNCFSIPKIYFFNIKKLLNMVFQEDITPKIDILLDADKTRQELLEIHDSEI